MENLLKSPVLYVTEEQLKILRQQYDITDEKRIKDEILVIREWLKKESHLVAAGEFLPNNIIEHMYFLSKGSIEGTKARIDNYCTSRGLAPELCLKRNIDEFDYLHSKMQFLVFPHLNPKDNSRITVTRFLSSDLDDVSLLSMLRFIILIIDYTQTVDYNFGIRSVVDLKNFPFSFFFKVNPMLVKKMESVCTKAYGFKIKGIHLINVPDYVDKILGFFKQSLSEKLVGRIHVHANYEELHEHISKEILPKDYNGDGMSCAEISDQWKQTLQSDEGRRVISNTENVVADEAKRSSCKFNEEYLGMPGSFRALNVD